MAFIDMGPITTVVKSALPPPPQAQPSVSEKMKPVPEAEIQAPVPPPPKGAQSGLGEHLDLYDTEKHLHDAENHPVPAEAEQAAREEKDDAADESHLLGNGTGLPQPSVEPAHADLPFLKPLGQPAPLGQAIDERI